MSACIGVDHRYSLFFPLYFHPPRHEFGSISVMTLLFIGMIISLCVLVLSVVVRGRVRVNCVCILLVMSQ